MRKAYPLLLIPAILISLLAVGVYGCSASSCSVTVAAKYVPPPYSHDVIGAPLPSTPTSQHATQTSPASTVEGYNDNNGLWLITCPQNPSILSSNPQYIFSSVDGDFGDFIVAGNGCEVPITPSSYDVKFTMSDYVSQSISGAPSVDDFEVALAIAGGVHLQTVNLGYSPELDTPDGDFISTNFDTQTYMFDSISPKGQQGLWTWYALVIDPSTLGTITLSATNSISSETYTYTPASGESCTYSYTLGSTVTLDSVTSAYIQVPVSDTSTLVKMLPFITYEANIINPEPSNEFNNRQIYDVYSPANLKNPQSLEPIGVNSLTLFLSAYNGVEVSSSPGGGGGAGCSVIDNMLPSSDSWQCSLIEQASSATGVPDVIIAGVEMQESGGTCFPTTNGAGYGGWFGLSASDMSEEGGNPSDLSVCSSSQPNAYLDQATVSAKFLLSSINDYHGWWEALCAYNSGQPMGPCNNAGNGGSCGGEESGVDCWYPTHVLDMIAAAGGSIPCVGPTEPGAWPGTHASGTGGACLVSGGGGGGSGGGALGNGLSYTATYSELTANTDVPNSEIGLGYDTSTPSSPATGGTTITIAPNSITAIPQGFVYVLGSSGGNTSTAPSGSYSYPVGNGCTIERTDQGKDWSGACPLCAVGSGTIDAWDPAGWAPYGGFLQLKLDNPPEPGDSDSSEYVYYAEGIQPTVSVGTHVNAGQVIAMADDGPDGIELGWGAGSGDHTLFYQLSGDYLGPPWNNNGCTQPGIDFVNFINKYAGISPTPPACSDFADPGEEYSNGACGGGADPPSDPDPPPAASTSGINIYILNVSQPGVYGATEYPPNAINLPLGTQSEFQSSWNSYWQNLAAIQAPSVFVSNIIPISGQTGSVAPGASKPINEIIQDEIVQESCGGSDPTANGCNNPSFEPENLTSDDFGDVYVIGQCDGCGGGGNEHTWIVSITNTLDPSHMKIITEPTCPNGKDQASGDNGALCTNQWDLITVSPTGAQVYIATPASGIIPIFNGQSLLYEYPINLNYGTDQALYAGLAGYIEAYPPAANVVDYLDDGGFYGLYPHNSQGNDCKSTSVSGCSPADVYLYNITSVELSGLESGIGWGGINEQPDLLDHSAWSTPTKCLLVICTTHWNNNFHHPVSIQDVHGYLYVLDYWSGITGQVCHSIIDPGSLLGTHECVHVGPVGGITDGINFGMLVLRVINSSGVDLPITPTYQNDLWMCQNAACNSFIKFPSNTSTGYPPFGWIVSATLESHTDLDTQHTLSLCGGGIYPAEHDNQNPSGECYQPDADYQGSYLPIGPKYNIWGCTEGDLGIGATCKTRNLIGTGFSVSFNDTVEIYIPSQEGITIQNTANPYGDNSLIFARFSPENYTKQIGGTNYLPFYYNCYDSELSPSIQEGAGGLCNYQPSVANVVAPTYLFTNPFQYDENIGSYQQLTIDEILSSSINPSSPISGSTGIYNPNEQTAANSYGGGASGAFAYYTCPSGTDCPTVQQFDQPTRLDSVLSGYVLAPYSYTYTINWYPSSVSGGGPGCTDSALYGSATQTDTNFTTSQSQVYNSQSATVEGSQTYAQSALNSTVYWQGVLSATSAPAQIFYNILTDRKFGTVYINATKNPYTNAQEIINASSLFSYGWNEFTQGGTIPGYATLYANEKSPACVGPKCASPLANTGAGHVFTNINDNFSANTFAQNPPQVVALFNWYKVPVYNNPVDLTLNKSNGGYNPYGYHRLVEVYNDRFNNTIYMPIDLDIANITMINLTVAPTVASNNANQTSIRINGTAYAMTPFTTSTKPLKNAPIYLYYDIDLNTVGYDASSDPSAAQSCAFTANELSSQCALSNPVWTGLTAHSNDVTYHTSYNSGGTCSQPPQSLLLPASDTYALCNIYNKGGYSASCKPEGGSTAYCIPLYTNGTGYCSSQVGLMGIVHTNSNGYFNTSITACGFGQHDIVAEYYGTGPEPIMPHQSPISLAADPSSTTSTTFTALNYSWTPVIVSQPAAIGTVYLSIGNISVIAGAAVALVVLAAFMLRPILTKSKQGRNRHR